MFKFSPNDQTPIEVLVTKGEFELSNSLTSYRGAGRVIASEVAESKLKTTVKQTIIPEDYTEIRKVLTGSENGTTVTNKVVYGSAAWEFTHSQDPNCTMSVVFSNVPWNCETPEIDPEGSAAEVEFSADDIGVAAKDGSPVTITIVNKVQTYAAA